MTKDQLIDMIRRWYEERDGFDLCNDKICEHCPRIRKLIEETKKLLEIT